MNRKPNKRYSAPLAAAGNASQHHMGPWGAMGGVNPMFYGWGPASQPTIPQGIMFGQQPEYKPWAQQAEQLQSDSDSDSDFQPSQKKRKLSLSKKASETAPTEKRGRGRPRKENPAVKPAGSKDFASKVPPQLEGNDGVALLQKDECKRCMIYRGSCVLKPCGHALCKQCVNELRHESIVMDRPSKCLNDECFSLVLGWWALNNVNA